MSEGTKTAGGASPATVLAEVVPALSVQAALDEAARCLYCYDAPCSKACPAAVDVATFIRKITTGNVKGAARVILEANALGGSCARVCPVDVLCEGACVLNQVQRPVAIGRLQRFATDWAAEKNVRVLAAGKPTGKRVAVVGAGPAGLACAAELAKLGHAVTIFEAREKPGGLNTYGIVPLRLPTFQSLAEAEMVRELGVEIKTGVAVGKDVQLEDLQRSYAAVFVGIGLGKSPRLNIPGEELPGVYDALDFLADAKLGTMRSEAVGARVAVIGGGNTALDAATVSKRLGAAEVVVLYRRSEREMPAHRPELEFARLEGVSFQWLTTPVRVLGDKRVAALDCIRMRLGDEDASGRARPIPVLGSDYRIEVDTVIKALGQEPLAAAVSRLGVTTRNGLIEVDSATGRTSNPLVFAGGDCVRGGSEVVFAVQEGKRAARGIHAAIMA